MSIQPKKPLKTNFIVFDTIKSRLVEKLTNQIEKFLKKAIIPNLKKHKIDFDEDISIIDKLDDQYVLRLYKPSLKEKHTSYFLDIKRSEEFDEINFHFILKCAKRSSVNAMKMENYEVRYDNINHKSLFEIIYFIRIYTDLFILL